MENSDLAELDNNFKERKIVYDYDDLYDHELDYDEWLLARARMLLKKIIWGKLLKKKII